ncbi:MULTISPECIES: quinohemoprotein amine dehydrogenase maturation protein [unclassified Pseudomonas]|uniref:quinohemoprotein amine dehydrogenase maturation protein n=1 Tax=unclassified Pseudomonas TaxID=196821 RepID=UPI000CD2B55B|nr:MULTISPECIES: quinohemoprotein amine dehydrogenase maturation protein [unclassified Pseudomonas]POA28196.1 quinohemoprotein amine dehydrogenase maturation protein [Pseudomonas sp. GW456-R21]POA62124.1 quinohemoprotein amine dehydrogenase maturation protein [Pseudomonas sp. GW460-R15]
MSDTQALYVNNYSFHDVALNGKRVLFHIPSSGLFELDEVGAALIDFIKHEQQFTFQRLRDRFAGEMSPQAMAETLGSFRELSILGDAPGVPDKGAKIEIKEFPISTIVLNVNTGCNLSCTYCYKEDLAVPSKGLKMNFETARKSIELLIAQGQVRDNLNVIFFGGEPLTNLSLIKQVVDYAEARCKEVGKQVDFSMTTNATMLTEEIVDYLDLHRFGVSISMDGPQAVHDRRRITVGGQGTYEVVANKARMLLKRYRSKPVGVRVTLTAGFTDVVAIHEHLKNDLGFAEVGVAPATSGPVTVFNLSSAELRQVFDSMMTLGRAYRDDALHGRNNGFSNMHQLMSDLYEGRKKALPCGAGVGLLSVDNKGDLNLCHRFTGSDMPTFGNVDEGIAKDRLGSFLEAATDRSNKGCSTCRIRNLCAGGCYHESYAHFGDPLSPTYHYCDLMREWVDFGIEIYMEILEKNPSFFQRHLSTRSVEL